MIQLKGGGKSEAAGFMKKALGFDGDKGVNNTSRAAEHLAQSIMRDPKQRNAMAKKMGIDLPTTRANTKSDNEDSFSDLDEDDVDLASFRAKRLMQMRKLKSMRKTFQSYAHLGHGEYSQINQDEFLPAVQASKYCLVHFSHPDYERCKIIDMHLSKLAKIHYNTRVIKIDGPKAPFFVAKLAVHCLPTLIFLKNGKVIHRMIGFQGVGGVDDFKTSELETYIKKHGLFKDRKSVEENDSSDSDDQPSSRYITRKTKTLMDV